MEDYLRKLIDKGSAYSDARYHYQRGSSISLVNGVVAGKTSWVSEGYLVRSFNNGLLTVFSSNEPKVDKLVIKSKSWETGFKPAAPINKNVIVPQVKPMSDASVEEKVKMLQEIDARVRSEKLNSKLIRFNISLFEFIERRAFHNSEGTFSYIERPGLWLRYSMVLENKGETISMWSDELGALGGLELLDKWNIHAELIEKVKSLDNILINGRAPPTGKMDVVVSSLIAGIIAHESTGHPFEADRVLGRESAQAGKSYLGYLAAGKFASEAVNVSDDPTIPGSLGFYLIDDEGIEARKKRLIVNGRVNELLQSRFTAYKMNAEPNGSMRSMDYQSEPLIRMSNTFFEPSNMKLDELIRDVRNGIFLKSYMEWNIDDIRWGQRYVGLEAYEIRNGEVGNPVKYPVLEASTGEIYSSIDAVDDELRFYAGMCGKGEPSQAVPVWMGGPDMRIRNIRVKKLGE